MVFLGRSSTVKIENYEGFVYNGEVAKNPQVTRSGSHAPLQIQWQKKIGTDQWEALSDVAPKAVGTYRVIATLPADENYGAASDMAEFTITPAIPTLSIAQVANRTYDKTEQLDPNVTVTGVAGEKPSGSVSFSWQEHKDGSWQPIAQNEIVSVGQYQVTARIVADGNYTAAESETVRFTIYPATPTVRVDQVTDREYDGKSQPNAKVVVTGIDGEKLEPVYTMGWEVEQDGNWEHILQNQIVNAGTYRVVGRVEASGNYTGVMTEPFKFVIRPAAPNVNIDPISDYVYSGMAPEAPGVTVSGVDGNSLGADYELAWQVKENGVWKATDQSAVKDVGTYRVLAKVTVLNNSNYRSVMVPREFNIFSGENRWVREPSIVGGVSEWITGDVAPEVDLGAAEEGTPVLTWTDSAGKVVEPVPVLPGTYAGTVSVAAQNWTSLSKTFEVRIQPVPKVQSMKLVDASGRELTEVYSGSKIVVKADGVYVPEVLKDNPAITFTLHSTPVELGTVSVIDGKAELEFTVPEIELGEHTMTASLHAQTGESPIGEQQVGELGVRVVAAPGPGPGPGPGPEPGPGPGPAPDPGPTPGPAPAPAPEPGPAPAPTPAPDPETGSGGVLEPEGGRGSAPLAQESGVAGLANTGVSVFLFAVLGLALMIGGAAAFAARSRNRA